MLACPLLAKSARADCGLSWSGNRHKADTIPCADWRHNPRAPRFFPRRTPTGEANIVTLLRVAYGSEIEVLKFSGSSPKWSPAIQGSREPWRGPHTRRRGPNRPWGDTPPLA